MYIHKYTISFYTNTFNALFLYTHKFICVCHVSQTKIKQKTFVLFTVVHVVLVWHTGMVWCFVSILFFFPPSFTHHTPTRIRENLCTKSYVHKIQHNFTTITIVITTISSAHILTHTYVHTCVCVYVEI